MLWCLSSVPYKHGRICRPYKRCCRWYKNYIYKTKPVCSGKDILKHNTKLICLPIGMRSCIQQTCPISIASKNTKTYARNSKSLFKCYSRSCFRKLNDKGEELTNDFILFHIDKNWSKLIPYKTIPKKFLRTILLFPLFRRVICELFEKGG